jgi:hypothetical protein
MADSSGGLFDSIDLRWALSYSQRNQKVCRKELRLLARYGGTRLADLLPLSAKG